MRTKPTNNPQGRCRAERHRRPFRKPGCDYAAPGFRESRYRFPPHRNGLRERSSHQGPPRLRLGDRTLHRDRRRRVRCGRHDRAPDVRLLRIGASTTRSSRSTGRRCRSSTAARSPSSRRSMPSASRRPETARRWIKVLRHVRIEAGTAFAELRPIDRGFRLDVEIDFESPVIGRSRKAMGPQRRRLPSARLPRPAPSA